MDLKELDQYQAQIPDLERPGVAMEYCIIAEDTGLNLSTSAVHRFTAQYPVLETGALASSVVLPAGGTQVIRVPVTNTGTRDWTWSSLYRRAPAITPAHAAAWQASGPQQQWHVSTQEVFTGTHAWFCGDPDGGTYRARMDAKLDTPAVVLGAQATLRFQHWAEMERNDSPDHDGDYWDGAVVELSTDGGQTFFPIAPVGGYPYRIVPNGDSPFEDLRPCLGGVNGGWQDVVFDLAAFAGQTVQARFRFGTDAWIGFRGWFVDQVAFAWEQAAWLQPVSSSGVLAPGETGWLAWTVVTTGMEPGTYDTLWQVAGNAAGKPNLAGSVALTIRPSADTVISLESGTALEDAQWMVLRWQAQTGRVYAVMQGQGLQDGDWQMVPGYTNLIGEGTMSYTGRIEGTTQRFFRIVEQGAEAP